MATYAEVWPFIGIAASNTPDLVEGKMDQMWHKSKHSLEADIPSFRTNPVLHANSLRTTNPTQEASPLCSQALKTPENTQKSTRQQSAESDDKVPLTSPKRRRKMCIHQGKTKRQARLYTNNASQSPKLRINTGHRIRSHKPNLARSKPIMMSSQHDTADEEVEADEFDLYDIKEENLTESRRRQRDLHRNRIAAKKFRGRKRDEATALVTRERDVEIQNRYLSTCYESLTFEVYLLKSELLHHASCNCALIQKYISNEAKKSVDDMNASLPNTQTYNQLTPTHLEHANRIGSCFDSETPKFESQASMESPETTSSGSPRQSAIQMSDGNQASYRDMFNHICNHMRDNKSKNPHDLGHTRLHAASNDQLQEGTYNQPYIYLASDNDRANEQMLRHSFNYPTGFGPSFTE